MSVQTAGMEYENELITRAQCGDRDAFGELIRMHRLGVVNVVYRMCGDSGLAEDSAQDAFLRAWQHIRRFQPHSSFRNWLYRIAVNAALDVLRREKPAADIEDMELTAAQDQVEASVERRQRLERVRKAVLMLPAASRAVLVLREYEHLSYAEIAVVLEIPAGTVMSRLSYARKRLLELLDPDLVLEEA